MMQKEFIDLLRTTQGASLGCVALFVFGAVIYKAMDNNYTVNLRGLRFTPSQGQELSN